MDLKHEEKTGCLCFGLAVSLLFPSRAPKALTSSPHVCGHCLSPASCAASWADVPCVALPGAGALMQVSSLSRDTQSSSSGPANTHLCGKGGTTCCILQPALENTVALVSPRKLGLYSDY